MRFNVAIIVHDETIIGKRSAAKIRSAALLGGWLGSSNEEGRGKLR